MTRQWTGIEPKNMCQNHLLGERSEIFKAIGGLLYHPHGLAMTTGQTELGNLDFKRIYKRFNQLSVEMKQRDFKHDTTLVKYWGVLHYFTEMGYSSEGRNREDLRDRCDGCEV